MTPRRRCKKRRFDEIGAKLALSTIARRDNASRPKTESRYYFCKSCKAYHLTSAPMRTTP